jgi:hypothetical protein
MYIRIYIYIYIYSKKPRHGSRMSNTRTKPSMDTYIYTHTEIYVYVYICIYIYIQISKKPLTGAEYQIEERPPHGNTTSIDRHKARAGATDTAGGPESPSAGAAADPIGSIHREHPSGAPIGRGDPH